MHARTRTHARTHVEQDAAKLCDWLETCCVTRHIDVIIIMCGSNDLETITFGRQRGETDGRSLIRLLQTPYFYYCEKR